MAAKKKIKRAIYPGTFDPVTNGHLSLIERASQIFDELIVGVASNAGKNPFFTFEERISLMKKAVNSKGNDFKIEVIGFEGLTAEFAKKVEAKAIIRGLRALSDFDYEFQMALMNRKMAREVETVFLMPALSWVYLSSSLVKDVARNGGEIDTLVPAVVARAMKKKLNSTAAK
jgi:pantetheine-phosphate adenylyltransferase